MERKILGNLFIFTLMLLIILGLINPRETMASSEYGDFSYAVIDGEISIIKYTGSADSVAIPASIDGRPVTKIGGSAFYKCKTLKNVTIPGSVISIGEKAFKYCTFLKDITIPDSVTSIGKGVFSQCKGIVNIKLPNKIERIEKDSFYNCTSLESIIIPEDVTSIERSAFMDCKKLKSINLPMGLTNIGSNAFIRCEAITEINLPKGITEIKTETFKGCISLNNIFIPKSVTQIYSTAFLDSNLSKIFGYKNSKAQDYATNYDIFFSAVYDIHFDTQGGNDIKSIIAVQEGNKIIKPEDPIRTGYVFGGWFKEDTLENSWNFEDEAIIEDITLYAKWIEDTYISTPKAQLLKETNGDSIATSMRLLSTIESLDFSEVGFVISRSNSNPLIDEDECIANSISIAYKKIKADGKVITTENLGAGEYIVVTTLNNILNKSFSEEVYVKPYVKDLDGTIHYGNIGIFSVEQCLSDLGL